MRFWVDVVTPLQHCPTGRASTRCLLCLALGCTAAAWPHIDLHVDRYQVTHHGGMPAAAGMCVSRVQKVRGVEFSYQPPPRNVVPYAAALKGQNNK